jgi:hypothetical protein
MATTPPPAASSAAPPVVVPDSNTKTKKTKDELQAQALRDADNARRRDLAATEDQKATKESVQKTLGTELTSGAQTRGPKGAALQGSSAERGELIGMRNGVPIYATAESLYGKARPADTPLEKEVQGPIRSAETTEEQRAAYQAREAPKAAAAAAAMAPVKPAASYFNPQAAGAYAPERARANALARLSSATDSVKSYQDAQKAFQASFGSEDSDVSFNEKKNNPNAIYQNANSLGQAGITASTLRRAAPLAQRDSGLLQALLQARKVAKGTTRRVVSRRPATIEESRKARQSK